MVASIGLIIGSVAAASAGTPKVCELEASPGGLSQYAVEVEPAEDGSRSINADIDRDGLMDELKWFAQTSPSTIPADPATATLTVTSKKQMFTLEQARLYVVKIGSMYYVATGWREPESALWHRELFAATKDGFAKICSLTRKAPSP
jgi:hypothetical protein